MYEDFFSLNCNPFQLSPDPFFMIPSEQSQAAFESISEAVRLRKGFAVMTGEVGTGKTLILRCLVEMWEREETPFAYFIGPRLSTVDFLSYIAFELGIEIAEPSKGNLLRSLYGFFLTQFEKGLTTVLIIDEAHQMPRSVLEEIRLLTNFETAQQKLVQIVLVGQPELDKKLDSSELRSLKQRIAVRCQLEPMGLEEIRHYIERRLELAGAGLQAKTIFPADTIRSIHRYSQGIPRLVNSICDQALGAAKSVKLRTVPVEVVRDIASRFRLDRAPVPKQIEKSVSVTSRVDKSVESEVGRSIAGVDVPAEKPKVSESVSGYSDGVKAMASGIAPSVLLETPDRTQPDDPSTVPEDHPEEQSVAVPHQADVTHPARTLRFAHGPALSVPSIFAPSAEPQLANPQPSMRFRPSEASPDTRPSRLRWWSKHKIRLSLFIALAAITPAALATGVYMARGKAPVKPAPGVSTGRAFPVRQPSAAQPSGEQPSTSVPIPVSIDTVNGFLPESADSVSNKAKEPNRWIHAPLVLMNTSSSRPMLKSRPATALAEAPSITGLQTKELALGNSLLDPATLGPKPPAAENVRNLQPPRLLSSPPPAYPSIELMGNRGGTVVINAVVDGTGKVTNAKVVSGNPVLQQAAMAALRTWKYEPARLNGQPTSAQIQVRINFAAR